MPLPVGLEGEERDTDPQQAPTNDASAQQARPSQGGEQEIAEKLRADRPEGRVELREGLVGKWGVSRGDLPSGTAEGQGEQQDLARGRQAQDRTPVASEPRDQDIRLKEADTQESRKNPKDPLGEVPDEGSAAQPAGGDQHPAENEETVHGQCTGIPLAPREAHPGFLRIAPQQDPPAVGQNHQPGQDQTQEEDAVHELPDRIVPRSGAGMESSRAGGRPDL